MSDLNRNQRVRIRLRPNRLIVSVCAIAENPERNCVKRNKTTKIGKELNALCLSFYCPGQEKEVDFLQLIQTPVQSDTIKFTTGFDGFPAFQLLPETDIRSPARNFLPGIFENFAILVTTKPSNERGGFLFSIMTPDDTVIQLGLSALASYG